MTDGSYIEYNKTFATRKMNRYFYGKNIFFWNINHFQMEKLIYEFQRVGLCKQGTCPCKSILYYKYNPECLIEKQRNEFQAFSVARDVKK